MPRWCLLAGVAALGGCAGQPAPSPVAAPVDATAAAIERAEAATAPAEKARHYLAALQAAHRRGAEADARELLALLNADPSLAPTLPPAGRFAVQAIALELALTAGDADGAANLAERLVPANARQLAQAARLQARALDLGTDHAAAALALMRLADEHAANGVGADVVTELAAAVWRHLSHLPNLALTRLAPIGEDVPAAERNSAAAWVALANAYNSALSALAQRRTWQRWRSVHPQHVAARFPPPSIARAPAPPRRLGLLVPVTGDYAAAAEAVRDGFIAAYLHTAQTAGSDTELRQEVRVYDTGRGAAAAYDDARADGVDVIVGPLRRAAVADLAALAPSVPVVALNNLDATASPSPTGASFHQLALAVEDEAVALANALTRTGAARVALFDSPGSWWARARGRFEAELDATQVVASGTLGGLDGVTGIAGEVLGIDGSTARHEALSAVLGVAPAFTPRRRTDVDAVVAFVDGSQLMALKPALDFHFAEDLPVYAPSRAVRGVAWARLNGLLVCDVPWRLHPQPLRRESAAFAASRGTAADLFALGIDGFRVANQLPRLTTYGEAIAGSTGLLRAGENGRIRRTPAWGRVRRGALVAIPPP